MEELIGKNLIIKSLFMDINSIPLIEEMAKYNQQLDRPNMELEELERPMKSGVESWRELYHII